MLQSFLAQLRWYGIIGDSSTKVVKTRQQSITNKIVKIMFPFLLEEPRVIMPPKHQPPRNPRLPN